MAELIWLEYFNDELYKAGMITEKERNQMKLQIEFKYGDKAPLHKPRKRDDCSR